MVYSSSAVFANGRYHDDAFFFWRQLKFAIAGLLALSASSRLPVEWLRRNVRFVLLFGVAVLVLVLIPGLGQVSGGARRWLSLGVTRVQPAEFAKLLVVVFMAHALARRHEGQTQSSLWVAAGWVQLIVGLVLLERDFGTAVILELIILLMLFVGGAKLGRLFLAVFAAIPVALYLIQSQPYRLRRMSAFLEPFADRRGAGYQLSEALLSLGSGGLFGVGLGDSRQKLYFLPEAHTDFIFAIIGEELGFIGCAFLILLFGAFIFIAQRIAARQELPFRRYLVLGLASWIGLQAGVNMCVATGLLPTKGLTLPFISYGGSSLLACCVGTGLILSIARARDEEETA
jgi:cell division protein FtsW